MSNSSTNNIIRVRFADVFLRQYKKMSEDLKDKIDEKVELFKNRNNHQRLKVHKLKGHLKNFYAFSVGYSHRIIFDWENGEAVVLLEVGDHDIYN